MTRRHISWLGVAGLALGLSGCLYVPRSTQVFDAECRIETHHMTMVSEVPQAVVNCENQSCGALLAAAGVVTAASAVVSGSIVVAGNIVYWFEKQGRCRREQSSLGVDATDVLSDRFVSPHDDFVVDHSQRGKPLVR